MKTTSLVQSVREITGNKKITEAQARAFASTNYLELVLFHNYEQKMSFMMDYISDVKMDKILDKNPKRVPTYLCNKCKERLIKKF